MDILISLRPEWCSLIASGKKKIEIRKSKPIFKHPFKVYIGATHGAFAELKKKYTEEKS